MDVTLVGVLCTYRRGPNNEWSAGIIKAEFPENGDINLLIQDIRDDATVEKLLSTVMLFAPYVVNPEARWRIFKDDHYRRMMVRDAAHGGQPRLPKWNKRR